MNSHCTEGASCSEGFTKTSEINITASPASTSSAAGEAVRYVNVTYTISASLGSEGSYNLDYFNSCPFLVPFAVLGSGQHATGSDFGGFFQVYDCAIQGGLENGVVTGVAGMSVGWIYDNGTTGTQTTNENCLANYNGFGSADENQTYPSYPILSMPTNSDAVVCVTYSNPTNTGQSFDLAGFQGVEIGTFQTNVTAPGTTYTWFSTSSNFTVTPDMTSLVLAPGASQTVSFLIHSDSDSKGFYYLDVSYLGPQWCNMGRLLP